MMSKTSSTFFCNKNTGASSVTYKIDVGIAQVSRGCCKLLFKF